MISNIPVDLKILRQGQLCLLQHYPHRRAAELRHVLVLVELLRGSQNAAAAVQVADPVGLHEPAPVPVRPIQLHVLAQQLHTLALFHVCSALVNALTHSHALTHFTPCLCQGGRTAVSFNNRIAVAADASITDDVLISGVQPDSDEEHTHQSTSRGPQLSPHLIGSISRVSVTQHNQPFTALLYPRSRSHQIP